ncbi:MAG TPA: hypothetical protein VIL71_06280 [Spirillospora sp.]
MDHCRKLLRPLHDTSPRKAADPGRRIGSDMGFHSADHWGDL